MHSSLVIAMAAMLVTGVMTLESPIPGYGVQPFEWEVELTPGHTELLNGTVEEVYAQVLQIDPEFKLASSEAVTTRDLKLNKRDIYCGNFRLADKGRISQGIGYLRTLGGAPRNGPGPGNCGRVSCSYNAAIWWCNDNTVAKTLDHWGWIADSAQRILNHCAPGANSVSGQNFEGGNWNTIVRGENC